MKSQNLLVAYVRSASQAAACQAAGRNYYDAYWEEIAAELGVAAACYESVAACCGALERHKVVFLGDVSVSAAEKERLQKFCADGGAVIGALTEGMDDLFGVEGVCVHPEADDEYTIQAYAGWDEAAAGYLPPTLRKNITLPVISRYRECRPAEDVDSLLFFLPPTSFAISGGRNSGAPLLTVRRIGKGRAYYFAFSLTQTLCNLHQGRPADRDWDGDGFYRTGDQITLTQCHDLSVPYGDLYLSMLEAVLDEMGIPTVWKLPPMENGEITELAVHFGGDDEYDHTNVQLPAAKRMHDFGLPYHLNLLPGGKLGSGDEFAVSREDYQRLKALGCERSIHFDFFKPRTFFTEEDVNRQLDTYEQVFGEMPVCSVNHVMMWTGWTDFPRWCEKRGMKGDASRVHVFLVPDANPVNKFGLAFGTAFPHFVMDDWRYHNRMLDYCYLPVMLYEPRVSEKNREEDEKNLAAILDRSRAQGWLLNFFIHPVYVSRDEDCVRAIAYTVKYLGEKGYRARFFGTDEACLWWHARKKTTLSFDGEAYTVSADYRDGAVLRFPDAFADTCLLDGKEARLERRVVDGKPCKLLAVAQGEHTVIF